MANALYAYAKQSFLGQSPSINMASDTIKAALVTAAYTANTGAGGDQFFSACSSNVVGTPQQLTSPTVSGGVFNAASPVTYTAVSGTTVTQIILYKDTGTATTSPLIAKIDVASNLPVTPNGGNITITWDSSASKIFAL